MLSPIFATLALATPGPITVTRVKAYDGLRTVAIAAAPSGSRFAASLETRVVRIMDAASGTTIRVLPALPDPAYAVAFSPNGQILATGDERGRITLWNLADGAKIREFTRVNTHVRGIQAVNFSADGKTLMSTGKDDVIFLWDTASGKPIRKILGKGANVYSATFMPGGLLATATLGSGTHFYKSGDGSLVASVDGHQKLGVLDVAFNAAGTRMVTGGKDGNGIVWDVKSRTKMNSLKGHKDWILRVAMSPNGRLAATSSSDQTVIVWDCVTFAPVAKLERQSFVGAPLAFTADGKFLLSANDMDALQINAISPAQGGSVGSATKRAAQKTGKKKL
ncbi:MAG TPA: WD40 repeat domain-containing protein [Fimbriimonadaceae bacterium]|nr:WD40 repeat domain-containing protein [Fimbriimonadaceae bacterium]